MKVLLFYVLFGWVSSLAYIKEGWPGVRVSVPTFQHQAAKNAGAVLGWSWMLTTFHMGENFLVWKPLIRKLSQRCNFPKNNAIAPYVRLTCVTSVRNWFRRHPADWHGTSASWFVAVRHVHITSQSKVTNFNHFIQRYHAVSSSQVSVILGSSKLQFYMLLNTRLRTGCKSCWKKLYLCTIFLLSK